MNRRPGIIGKGRWVSMTERPDDHGVRYRHADGVENARHLRAVVGFDAAGGVCSELRGQRVGATGLTGVYRE